MGAERRPGAGVPRVELKLVRGLVVEEVRLDLGDEGVLVALHADLQAAEKGCEQSGEQGDGRDGDEEPSGEGVPLL